MMKKIQQTGPGFDDRDSITAALFYLEEDMRECAVNLTGFEVKKAARAAIDTLNNQQNLTGKAEEDVQKMKTCLDKILEQRNTDLMKFLEKWLEQFAWYREKTAQDRAKTKLH